MTIGRLRLRHLNRILILAIVLINGYVVAVPLLPSIAATPTAQKFPVIAESKQPATHIVEPDTLLIPSIGLQEPINEGNDTYRELSKGVLRWPASSTPSEGSNTVLLGHRFTYTQPRGVFYFLNRVQVGDIVRIVWHNTTHTYTVTSVRVVSPDNIAILNSTSVPTVTIYTCTPLWLPTSRLVITAQGHV